MTFNPLAAGKKVYSNGSYAPTRGTVNPAGYVARENRQSQRRSGLAATALNRVQNQLNPTGLPYGANLAQKAPGDRRLAGRRKPRHPKPKPNPPLHSNPNHPPNVQVSPNGQLNLPWNAHNALQAIAAQNLLNQRLQANQAQMDQYRLGYQQNLHGAEIQNQLAQENILNNDADRGMAFSSGHARNVADQATAYNQYTTDLMNQKNQFRGAIKAGNTEANNAFLDQLRQLAINQGLNLEKYAGQLGLDRSTNDHNPKPKPHHPKPKPHHHKPRHSGIPDGVVPTKPRSQSSPRAHRRLIRLRRRRNRQHGGK